VGLVCDGDFAMAGVSGRVPGRIAIWTRLQYVTLLELLGKLKASKKQML
jgi:hypothetical protein